MPIPTNNLFVGENTFVDVVPTWLAQRPQLTALYQGANQIIGTLPAVLCNLTRLTKLDLSCSNLTGGDSNGIGPHARTLVS